MTGDPFCVLSASLEPINLGDYNLHLCAKVHRQTWTYNHHKHHGAQVDDEEEEGDHG